MPTVVDAGPSIDPQTWIEILPQVEAISKAYAKNKARTSQNSPFRLPKFPKAALPPESVTMAMDSALCDNLSFANQDWLAGEVINGVTGEGLLFLGYSYLSELAQRPEYRVMAETIADDATRKWIDFDVVGDAKTEREKRAKDPAGYDERMADPDERQKRLKAEGKLDKVKAMRDDQLRLCVKDRIYEQCRNDGFFGRSHLFLDIHTNGPTSEDELKIPIGDGRDSVSKSKVPKGSFKDLRTIEPVWTYPLNYNANDPLAESWYNPQVWYVMGKEIHGSRLQTFIGHPVPDMLKPAYAFGGLSLTQMAKPYVDIWLQTRQSVADLIHSFSVMVLMTDLSTLMQPGNVGALLARAAMFNMLRDNNGLFVANKNTEDFKNVSASLSGLHELQSQAQEHMACLPAGTLIETARGQVPIEAVTLEDMVLTREGFSSLKWVGVTGQSDTLISIKGDGFEISATRYHPIWSETDQDFVAAESVSTSHRLRKSTREVGTVRQSFGEVVGGGRRRADIIGIKKRVACFTVLCGKRIAALSRMVTNFITSTTMGPTTIGTTSNCSPGWSTNVVTLGLTPETIPGTVKRVGIHSSVRSSGQGSAHRHARQSPAESATDGSHRHTRGHARIAGSPSRLGVSTLGSAPGPACSAAVLSVSEIKVPLQPVYNLEVDGLPEFFANGVLVHNSVHRIPLVKFTGIQPSGLNACLPGDTMILTERGRVPIRDVTLSDRVMTRQGLAPLTFSGVTKYATELIEIKTESATLRCTDNHPIWLSSTNEFVRAENVRIGDRLLSIGEKRDIQKMHPRVKTAENTAVPTITPIQRNGRSERVVSVSRVRACEPVYDLSVASGYLPEFFANGILTHNSSEGEIKVYDDTIMAYQSRFIAPNLTKIINFEQLSLFGEIDPSITYKFMPLREMTQAEKGQKEKDDADRNQKYVDMGALHPAEVRAVIINDPDLPYTELDPDDVPDLLEEEQEGLEPVGGRPQTGGGEGDGKEGNESSARRTDEG